MLINVQDVEKLAELARLELSTEEKNGLLQDMQGILTYVSQVENAPKSDISEEFTQRNIMREDENPHGSGIYTEAIIAQMPDSKDGFLKVKKILE